MQGVRRYWFFWKVNISLGRLTAWEDRYWDVWLEGKHSVHQEGLSGPAQELDFTRRTRGALKEGGVLGVENEELGLRNLCCRVCVAGQSGYRADNGRAGLEPPEEDWDGSVSLGLFTMRWWMNLVIRFPQVSVRRPREIQPGWRAGCQGSKSLGEEMAKSIQCRRRSVAMQLPIFPLLYFS